MKQLLKRLFGVFLALTMLITLVPAGFMKAVASAAQASSDYATGDIITFGSYPQSKVTDSSLITSLNSQTLSADNTVIYDGIRYKRVYFTKYTPAFYSIEMPNGASYQDDNGYFINMVYWFKFEPIEWCVLSDSSGELFVMSEKILDSKKIGDSNWGSSLMRSWLNGSFYNTAFSSAEKSQINVSTVVNSGSSTTNDKLFLLSNTEVINAAYGFSTNYANEDIARKAQGTDFSKSSGLYVYQSPNLGNSYWWLRTPYHLPDGAGIVNDLNGTFFLTDYTATSCYGVRPVLKLKLDPATLTPVENSGCVVNSENKFIYGLKAGITNTQFESNYIRLNGDVRLEYSAASGNLGTNTKVDVIDNATNAVLATYTIVIFGDVTGDGNIDSNDSGILADAENYMITWDPLADAANIKAADVNGDGNVDSNDAGLMVEVENYNLTLNQSTGLAY